MNCLYCGTPLEGRKSKKFCGDAHKMAYWRKQHEPETADRATLIRELETAQERIAELEDYNLRLKSLLTIEQQRVAEQEQEVRRLKALLDIEQRYYDNQPRNFRGWLRKQPRSDLITRLLARDTFPLKGSRAYYEVQVRALKGPASDLLEFADLWRAMLLSQP